MTVDILRFLSDFCYMVEAQQNLMKNDIPEDLMSMTPIKWCEPTMVPK